MRRFLPIAVLCLMALPAWADVHTSVGSGDWSDTTTWDAAAVPADGDTVVIASPHTVVYDANMATPASWPNGVTLTINAGGEMDANTAAGYYYLKAKANITLNGTLRAGTSTSVPYPATCTFTTYMNGNYGIVGGAAAKLYLYCTQPTYKIIKLSGDEAIGQTEWSVNTDVSADPLWTAGNEVVICDVYPGTTAYEVESRTIDHVDGGVSPLLTVTAGLTAAKSTGAWIYIIRRNVRILSPSTTNTYTISFNASSTAGSTVNAEINGSGTGYRGTIGGIGNTIQGVISGFALGVMTATSSTISYICNCSGWGTNGCLGSTLSYVGGTPYASYSGVGNTIKNCGSCSYIDGNGKDTFVSDSGGNQADIYGCANDMLGGVMGVSGKNIYNCYNGKAYNCALGGTAEFSGYNSPSLRCQFHYFESFDHDQSANAYKAWTLGGLVTSQTASPPTGYTIYYRHTCESASYPCFRQYSTVVDPNQTIIVTGLMRVLDGNDLSADPPALQIIDTFADPLVDSTKTPLADCHIPVSNGTNTTWQNVAVSWTNTAASPKTVYVRTYALHATENVDECLYSPNEAAQVSAIYTKLPTNYIAGSATAGNLSFDFPTREEIRAEMDANSVILHDVNDYIKRPTVIQPGPTYIYPGR